MREEEEAQCKKIKRKGASTAMGEGHAMRDCCTGRLWRGKDEGVSCKEEEREREKVTVHSEVS